MSTQTRKISNTILALLCVIFIVFILIGLNKDISLQTNKGSEPDKNKTNIEDTVESGSSDKPIEQYQEIVDRPLFYENRQAPDSGGIFPDSAAPGNRRTSGKSDSGNFIVSGIVITGSTKVALLEFKKDRKIQKFTEGDDLDGWIIANIFPSHLELQKGEETKQLPLMVKGSPPVPAKPAEKPAPPTEPKVPVKEKTTAPAPADGPPETSNPPTGQDGPPISTYVPSGPDGPPQTP